jgi:hypothetical protein
MVITSVVRCAKQYVYAWKPGPTQAAFAGGFARPVLAYDLLSLAKWITCVRVKLMLMTYGSGGFLACAPAWLAIASTARTACSN